YISRICCCHIYLNYFLFFPSLKFTIFVPLLISNCCKFYAPFVIANCGTYFPNLQQGVEDFIAAENGDVNRFANALQYVRDLVATEAGNEFNNAPRFVQEPVAYFSFGSANPDKSPHLRSYGNGVYGFEDLPATATQYSNNDFNDAVFALS
ncbi:DUF4114 domain-containing protein, partial [Aphanizomenon sp. FACHB-1401]|nr:DUF4114 domain-containing protein [Aphanizomenon flos-aquae FACHB-1171]MBD2644583.1 DUF4114 domain-containing protein [Aphanizomenon sp. FACHB-1401]